MILWFDDSGAPLRGKIRKAADYYKGKYGNDPDLCLLQPDDLETLDADRVGRVAVESGHGILPHHMMLGVTSNRASRCQQLVEVANC